MTISWIDTDAIQSQVYLFVSARRKVNKNKFVCKHCIGTWREKYNFVFKHIECMVYSEMIYYHRKEVKWIFWILFLSKLHGRQFGRAEVRSICLVYVLNLSWHVISETQVIKNKIVKISDNKKNPDDELIDISRVFRL